jgi:hypothetical protein
MEPLTTVDDFNTSSGGYTCGCGVWVGWGLPHTCLVAPATYVAPAPLPTYYVTYSSDPQIVELLVEIRDLLKQIEERTPADF